MDFIKEILEKAVYVEGKIDIDATMKLVNVEFPKHAVSKADFNAKIEALKIATATIETLKKDNTTNETLQATIKAHETTIASITKDNETLKKSYALKDALKQTGCSDPDYLIFKQGGIDKFTFDKSGVPVGVDDVVKSYKDSSPLLFPTGSKEQSYSPSNGNSSNQTNPFAKETANMTEQGKLFKENPEKARALALAAGLTI